MNIAYQNLAVEFDHFILPKNITATNLTLIQAEESTTTYEINIIKNTTTYSETVNLISDTNTKLLIKSDIGSVYLNTSFTQKTTSITNFTGTIDNESYEFNGSDDYFEIPLSITPDISNSDFTIEFWANINATPSGGILTMNTIETNYADNKNALAIYYLNSVGSNYQLLIQWLLIIIQTRQHIILTA